MFDISKTIDDILQAVAEDFAQDLHDYIWENHRVTGKLADSIKATQDGDGEWSVGSDLPYATLFESCTGAVADFTDRWMESRGQTVVANVADKVEL